MSYRKLVMYLHLLWGTKEGKRWITADIEHPIYRCVVDQENELGWRVLTINGVPDQLHLVVRQNSTVPVAQIVKQAKGVSAKFLNDHFLNSDEFRWCAGYGAFTISRWDLPMIIKYVKNQKQHHGEGNLRIELEDMDLADR